jgi:predicted ArsR family transcriptional regulator
MNLENEDLIILNALLRKPRLTFQEIVNFWGFKRALNRNRARARLDALIENQIIREDNREQWKRGRKLWFVLTEKGKSVLLEKTLSSVKESLETVGVLVSGMLSEPEKLVEWKKTGQKAVRNIVKAEDLTLEEKIQQTMKTRDVYFGTFRRALWKMHQISLNFAPSKISQIPLGEVYVHVTERGVINVVSEDELLLRAPDIQVHTF